MVVVQLFCQSNLCLLFRNLPPLHDSTKPNLSEISEKVDWSSKDKSGVSGIAAISSDKIFKKAEFKNIQKNCQPLLAVHEKSVEVVLAINLSFTAVYMTTFEQVVS